MSRKFLIDIEIAFTNATSDIRRKRDSRFVNANRFTRGLEAGLGTSRMVHEPYRNFADRYRNFADPL